MATAAVQAGLSPRSIPLKSRWSPAVNPGRGDVVETGTTYDGEMESGFGGSGVVGASLTALVFERGARCGPTDWLTQKLECAVSRHRSLRFQHVVCGHQFSRQSSFQDYRWRRELVPSQ